MIVTVTLNAAIDRTLTVPNFQRGQRHRASAGVHARGRQGHQRRARAEDARRPGRRDRARRRPDRHAHRRAADRRGDPQRLRAHRGRVADVDRRRRPDRRHVHGDQRVGAGGAPRGARHAAREAPLPVAGRRAGRVRRLAAARRRATTSTPRRSTSSRAATSSRCSTARASRCGSASRPSRSSSRRTRARPRRSSARSSTTTRTSGIGLETLAEMGPRNVLITTERGCVALLREDRDAHRFRAVAPRVEPVSRGRLRRRAPRRLPRRAPRRPHARGGAARRRRRRRGLDARGRRRPLRPAPGGPAAGRCRALGARARPGLSASRLWRSSAVAGTFPGWTSRSSGSTQLDDEPPGQVRQGGAHLRRRPARAGRVRGAAERGLDRDAADAHDRARGPGRLGGDGHGHRGADGDRARARGRHRDPAPQPLDRRAGGRGRQGEALRVRDDRRAGHAARRTRSSPTRSS